MNNGKTGITHDHHHQNINQCISIILNLHLNNDNINYCMSGNYYLNFLLSKFNFNSFNLFIKNQE